MIEPLDTRARPLYVATGDVGLAPDDSVTNDATLGTLAIADDENFEVVDIVELLAHSCLRRSFALTLGTSS